MPSVVTRGDLADLASRYDATNADSYLTVYADLTDRDHGKRLDARARQVRAALGRGDAAAGFEAAYAVAREALDEARVAGGQGAAVFVNPAEDYRRAFPLSAPVPTELVLDSSPYIRPLAQFDDAYESFLLVLLDGERGAIYVVEDAVAEAVKERELDLLGRHTKGGWSQMRYQRARQNVVDRFHEDMAQKVAALVQAGEADRIVVAGPGNPKKRFLDRLPRHLQEKVLAVEDVDFDAPHAALVRRFVDLAREEEATASRAPLDALRRELLMGELAVTGAFSVVRAARDGRVEVLVVLKDHTAGGAKCEAHQSFFAADAACECGARGNEVDLVNEAVEYAYRAESRVEFLEDDGFLRDVGGVAAILRW